MYTYIEIQQNCVFKDVWTQKAATVLKWFTLFGLKNDFNYSMSSCYVLCFNLSPGDFVTFDKLEPKSVGENK